MKEVDFNKSPFSIYNPYESSSAIRGEGDARLIGKRVQIEDDSLIDFANRVTEWGKTLLFNDYEKQLDFSGKVARILDWSTLFTVGSMQAILITERLFHYNITHLPVFKAFPTLLKILTLPTAIFFLVMTIFEGFVELVNLRRAGQLLYHLRIRQKDPLAQLQWVKEHYFTLDQKEGKKIEVYIEQTMPLLSQVEKARRFEQIAHKALRLKYEGLKRRISPGLAEEVLSQIHTISKDLESFSPVTKAKAAQRAEVLMKSLTRQTKNKILVHVLGVTALGITLISLSVFLAKVTTTAFFAIMGAMSISLTVLSFLINKGTVAKETEKLYDKLEKFNLQVKENSVLFPLWLKAL